MLYSYKEVNSFRILKMVFIIFVQTLAKLITLIKTNQPFAIKF